MTHHRDDPPCSECGERPGLLQAEIERLRAALTALVQSAKPCPSCAPENDCYVFSMTALANAGGVLEQRAPEERGHLETPTGKVG